MPIATLNTTTAAALVPVPLPPDPSINLPPIDPQLRAVSSHDGHGTGC